MINHIIEQFPAFKRVWGSGAVQVRVSSERPRRKRRRASFRKPRPLTDRQRDGLDLLAKHGGDLEAAAAEWGISRQAMSKLRNRARERLQAAGQMDYAELVAKPAGPKARRPQRLPHDRRGQEILADPDARNPMDSDD